ncbi:MAG: hypothetical protein IPP17_31290 [Bacteroidetes bacterium]|nr:hypothetical protein [Bacteroidota bacterium]
MEANIGIVRATGKPRCFTSHRHLPPETASEGDDNREKEEILRFTEKDPVE